MSTVYENFQRILENIDQETATVNQDDLVKNSKKVIPNDYYKQRIFIEIN